jgi:hypothetical protein
MRSLRAPYALTVLTSLVAAFSLATAGIFFAPSAYAAPQYLSVTKAVVGNSTVTQGSVFTYDIVLSCSEADCINASVVDQLPEEFSGFKLREPKVTPATTPHTLEVTNDGQPVTFPATIGADTKISLEVAQPLADDETGLPAANTITLVIQIEVPSNIGLSPLSPNVGHPIKNTAESSAENSASDTDSANITVDVPQQLNAAITKGWSPASATVGQSSTITLTGRNTSNVPVDTLVIQEPANPGDSTDLDANNPFTLVDLNAISTCTLPSGATAVRVDAYVQEGTNWVWKQGTAEATCTLPENVDADDVGGLRFTFTGDMPINAQATVGLAVVQQTSDNASITNTASAQTKRGSETSATVTVTAPYSVAEPTLGVTISKSFNPSTVAKGNHTTATITARNNSRGQPVSVLTISESDLPGKDFQFINFTAAINYPGGADEAKVVYQMESGPDQTITFASGDIPAIPSSGTVVGFDVIFTSTDGPLDANAQASVSVELGTSGGGNGNRPNTATATVAEGANTATNTATAYVNAVNPNITATLSKTISPPWTAVSAGEKVVTSLYGRVQSNNAYVRPTSIVITDQSTPEPGQRDFWDGFNLLSLPSVPILANSALHIEVLTGSGWITLKDIPTAAAASTFSMTTAEIESVLGNQAAREAVTGIRFSYTSAGFAQTTTVNPYVAYQARSSNRSGPASTGDDPTTPWVNNAEIVGTITTDDGGGSGGNGGDSDFAFIFGPDCEDPKKCIFILPGEEHPLIVPTTTLKKSWSHETVHAQSSEARTSTLFWDTTAGAASVTISDPITPGSTAAGIADTVFDAFNLVSIPAISYSNTVYSNGWALRYDTVTSVLLYNSDTALWEEPACKGSTGWMNTSGFRGCTLTPAEQASTTGVRITVEPNDAVRASSVDPFAPAVGSGVTSNFSDPAKTPLRSFTLNWQIREKKRSDGSWVIRASYYNYINKNTNEPVRSWVVNDASLTMKAIDTAVPDETVPAEDRIEVIDTVPGVGLSKTFSNGADSNPLLIPGAEDAPPASYPSTTMTLRATNQAAPDSAGAVAKASYIRITEPALLDSDKVASMVDNQSAIDPASAKANPFSAVTELVEDSFFDRFTVTNIKASASTPAQVDLTATTVWLLHDDFTTTQTTATALNAMTAADLADVIGVSATFQGSDPVVNGGSITISQSVVLVITAQARTTFRVSGDPQRLAVNDLSNTPVSNTAFAQSYDPVQFTTPNPIPEEADRGAPNGALSANSVYLSGGRIAVTTSKSFSPNTVTEPNRATPITVNLGANASDSTLAATSLVIEDGPDNTDFWGNMAFTGLGTITAPAGADQVKLCAYGAFDSSLPPDWKCATDPEAIATATLPIAADQYPLVQGLKAEFSRADGTAFGPYWTTSVPFTAVLRADNVSGQPVTFPGSASNTVNVSSSNSTLGESAKAEAKISSPFAWEAGSRLLALGKIANGGAANIFPGDSSATADIVPFNLTIKNNGSGYLHLDSVVDQLPVGLHYSTVPRDPDQGAAYRLVRDGGSPDATTVSTEPLLTVGDIDADGQTLTFTWPTENDQNRLLPNETLTITVYGWMELGVYQVNDQVKNTLKVTTVEDITGAVGVNNAEAVLFAPATNARLATTTATVTPHQGTNFRVALGVAGSLGTASPSSNPDADCDPTMTAPGESSPSHFSSPCISDSAIGTKDSWLLHAVNAGTTNISEVVFFKTLPALDDLLLVAGDPRGSTYRPHLVSGSLSVTALGPDKTPIPDTNVLYEVSLNDNACTGTWSALALDPATPACESVGETWTAVGPSTDWPNVKAIRVKVTFKTPLGPAGTVDVQFDTVNIPETAVGASDGANAELAADYTAAEYAWGQFGVIYSDATRTAPLTMSPPKVGVTLANGSFSVFKQIVGEGTEYAPASFDAKVTCTIDYQDAYGESHTAPLTFDGSHTGTLLLHIDNGLAAEVTSVPLGTECQVVEAGAVGAYGEVAREYTDAEFTIAAGVTPQVVLTNVYAAPPPLPRTGLDVGTPLLAAVLFLLGGAVMLRIARLKRS